MIHHTHQVLIIGAGLAGLACGRELHDRGIDFKILESSSRLGGRMGSTEIDGMTCDIGFQVSMSNYEWLERLVPRKTLPRYGFTRGAVLVSEGKRIRVIDPKSEPLSGIRLLFSGLAGWRDLRAANRCRVIASKARDGQHVDGSARELVESVGFSKRFLESFICPFFSGVLLDEDLDVPAARFLSTLDRFARGQAELPAGGMQRIAEAMAQPIQSHIALNQTVARVGDGWVELDEGSRLTCEHVVLALPFDTICKLTGQSVPKRPRPWSSTAAVHFSSRELVPDDPIIYLNASGSGHLNLACVPSVVAPKYAPEGAHSVVASLRPWKNEGSNPVFSADLIDEIRQEAGWLLGVDSSKWRHVHTDSIPMALPRHQYPELKFEDSGRIHATGDWVHWPSIDSSVHGGIELAISLERTLREEDS